MADGKWTNCATDPAGPIQVGKFNKAIRALTSLAHNVRELSGVKGRSEQTSTLWIMGGGPGKYAKPREEAKRIGDAHGWTLTRKGCNAILAEVEAAHKACNNPDLFPVEDRRREPEVADADAEAQRVKNAEEAKQRAERRKALDAILAKRPHGAAAAIVAEFAENESNSMTDYWGHRTTRKVIIGWRTGTREDFKQLRRAAGLFEPTAHLGQDRTPCTIEASNDTTGMREPGHFLPESLQPKDGDRWARSFERIEEARAAMEAEGYAMVTEARQSYSSEKWRKEGTTHTLHVVREEVEHRDNYSMGEGNWLGTDRHSGWKVRSRDLPFPSHEDSYVWEDGLPTSNDPSPTDPSKAPTRGEGYTVEEHTHTKKGTRFALVVLADRVDRERFENLRDSAKRAGGWYSRQWGSTPGGFAFDARGAAEAWAAETLGGGAPTPPDGGGEPEEAPKADAPTGNVTTGERLGRLADAMQEEIDHKRAPLTQNATHRRLRIKEGQRADADRMEQTQQALRALAAAWNDATIPNGLRDLLSRKAVHEALHDYIQPGASTLQRRELLALIEKAATPEDKGAAEERARKAGIEKAENEVRFWKVPGFFPTPKSLVSKMIEAANIPEGGTVLEPSAGIGSILDVMRAERPDVKAYGVEVSFRFAELCRMKGHKVVCSDFLEDEDANGAGREGVRYDAVLMNPPFENDQAGQHVRHAFEFLNDGGTLVAIVDAGIWTRSTGKAQAFRDWLEGVTHESEDLPEGSFTGAEAFRQTSVRCVMLTIRNVDIQRNRTTGDEVADRLSEMEQHR